MTVGKARRRRAAPGRLCLAGFVCAALAARAAETPAGGGDSAEMAEIRAKAAAFSSIGNADSSVRVAGGMPTLHKQTILTFAEDVRARLETLLDAPFRGPAYRMLIAAEPGPGAEDGAAPATLRTVYAAPSTAAYGAPPIRIIISSPDNMDPRDLAREICAAYASMRILVEWERAAPEARAVPSRLPEWFPAGVARYLDGAMRQADAEEALALWQGAALPPLWSLASTNGPPGEAAGATVSAYWISRPGRAARLDGLCARLAAGEAWSADLFAESLGTNAGAAAFAEESAFARLRADRDFDAWLLERRDAILTPGATPRSHTVRAWRELLLTPGEDSVPEGVAPDSPTALLIANRSHDWARQCAAAKAAKILRLAAGRGDGFHEAARAYAEFFSALAKGVDEANLRAALAVAEHMLLSSADAPPAAE